MVNAKRERTKALERFSLKYFGAFVDKYNELSHVAIESDKSYSI
jgi:hypothetical protein